MCDRQNRNVICQSNEYNVIREIVNRETANVRIGEAGNECPC